MKCCCTALEIFKIRKNVKIFLKTKFFAFFFVEMVVSNVFINNIMQTHVKFALTSKLLLL